ncbi:MAG: hypothetical protein ACLTSM_01305 [Eubacterium sp.]
MKLGIKFSLSFSSVITTFSISCSLGVSSLLAVEISSGSSYSIFISTLGLGFSSLAILYSGFGASTCQKFSLGLVLITC